MSSWEVPGGFTNTGLCALPEGTLAIGDFKNSRIVVCTARGYLVRSIPLESAPSLSVQGVAWDTSRGHYWVCHYAASPMGSLRRYGVDGSLLQTISLSGVATTGPNGSVYDAANDRVLIACGDNRIRGINCTTGAVDENLALGAGVVGSGLVDGVTLDPISPTTTLWVSIDAPSRRVHKVSRSTGNSLASADCPAEPESLAWASGFLYMCCDQNKFESLGSGSAVPNGNRVHWFSPESPGTHTIDGSGYGGFPYP